MSETPHDKAALKENSTSIKPFIIAALLMGAIAAGVGWFLGNQMSASLPNAVQSAHTLPNTQENPHAEQAENHAILPMPPIMTNLDAAQRTWVRLEFSLILKENETLTPEQQAEISNDFIALLRQMTLLQIKGPTGLMNLRDDLLDRTRVRSEGKVSAVLISNLVIE